MQTKKSEIGVGLFVLVAFIAVIFLCLKVADIKSIGNQSTYRIYAIFNNVGGLKINSPVKIGGVVIGRVADISLDKKNYNPLVAIDIQENYNHIPNSSSLAIRTAGLLGEQFLALNVGFEDQEMGTGILKAGDTIEDTKSALILEDLIGQLIYKKDDNNTVANSATSTQGGF